MTSYELDAARIRRIAEMIGRALPADRKFIVLIAPVTEGNPDPHLHYLSNLDRKTAINLLKEWLIKASGPEEWMKRIQ